MRALVLLLALVAAFAAGTWWLGWWAVPALALAYGLWRAGTATPRSTRTPGASGVGLAAGLAWGALLASAATAAPIAALAGRLAALMAQPAPALYAATLIFPALLAWSAASLGESVRARR